MAMAVPARMIMMILTLGAVCSRPSVGTVTDIGHDALSIDATTLAGDCVTCCAAVARVTRAFIRRGTGAVNAAL